MKVNYHTHTARCNHAQGSDEDFVRAAIGAGFDRIGFSDHTPWNYRGYVSGMRMRARELAGYADSVHTLQEKYSGQIEILLGLECEFFSKRLDWLRAQMERYDMDYVILGHHFSQKEERGDYNGSLNRPDQIRTYGADILAALDTGLFSSVA